MGTHWNNNNRNKIGKWVSSPDEAKVTNVCPWRAY